MYITCGVWWLSGKILVTKDRDEMDLDEWSSEKSVGHKILLQQTFQKAEQQSAHKGTDNNIPKSKCLNPSVNRKERSKGCC